jgi:hypothetical protein
MPRAVTPYPGTSWLAVSQKTSGRSDSSRTGGNSGSPHRKCTSVVSRNVGLIDSAESPSAVDAGGVGLRGYQCTTRRHSARQLLLERKPAPTDLQNSSGQFPTTAHCNFAYSASPSQNARVGLISTSWRNPDRQSGLWTCLACVQRPVWHAGSSSTTHFIDRSDRFNQFDHIASGLYFAFDSVG